MKSFARFTGTLVGLVGIAGLGVACGTPSTEADDGGDNENGGSGATATGGVSGTTGTGGNVGGSGVGGASGAATTGGSVGTGGVATGGTGAVAGSGGAGTGGANPGGAAGVGAEAGSGGIGMGGAGAGGAGAGGAGAGGAGAGGAAGKGGASGAAGAAGSGPCTGGKCVVPAFPGADGAAGMIAGGRNGDVCHVTLLDTDFSDVRAGTLRACLSNLSGPRTVVFDVSGVFSLGRTATSGYVANGNGWDTACRLNLPANVTIAGQTAPGPVVIMGGSLRPGASNIIVRNITVAPGYGNRGFQEANMQPVAGDFPDSYVYDAFDISGQNVMLDHVTTVFATDETISCNELANNLTIQYSNISQGQNYPQGDAEASGISYTGHALGSLLQPGSNAKVSVLHNLYAHQKGRLPRIGSESGMLTTAGVGGYDDFRNNVIYNWLGTAGTGASGQAFQANFIGNFYQAGPGGDNPTGGTATTITTASGGTSIFNGSDATLAKLYHSGNMKDVNKDADANDGTALANSDFGTAAIQGSAYTQTPYMGVTATATAAYTHVLSYAGSRWWARGVPDTRIVAEVRAGTGRIIAWADDPFNSSTSEGTEWRSIVGTPMMTRAAGYDSDADGMPNTWESSHGFNPMAADNNGDADMDGYTNLEEYLNEVAAWPALAALEFTGKLNRRYAQIQNWRVGPSKNHTGVKDTANWQPSRYDTAQIQAGTAIVDSVGQHAGILEVGAAGTLDVTGGWLDAERAVTVGGRVNLRGGALRTGVLSKVTRGSVFDFTGGSLSADVVKFDLVSSGGELAPGRGVGAMDVAGNVTMRGGALVVDVRRGGSDVLRASGTVTLSGSLRIETVDGYAPRVGESWTIVVADGGVRGGFDHVTEGYSVSIVGRRVTVTYGEALECVALLESVTGDAG